MCVCVCVCVHKPMYVTMYVCIHSCTCASSYVFTCIFYLFSSCEQPPGLFDAVTHTYTHPTLTVTICSDVSSRFCKQSISLCIHVCNIRDCVQTHTCLRTTLTTTICTDVSSRSCKQSMFLRKHLCNRRLYVCNVCICRNFLLLSPNFC